MKPRVLLVGNYRHPDFSNNVAELELGSQLTRFTSVAEAAAWLAGNAESRPVIDEILIAQAHPGEILAEEITLLRRAAPLARFTALLGSWCEGEARTGKPWPDVERRYWHSYPASDVPANTTQINLGIYAWRFEDYEALAAALEPLARALVWLDPRRLPLIDSLDSIVWDGRSGDAAELADMMAVSERYRGVPLVALFNFPRHDAAAAAKSHGAVAVLGKPFRLNSLRAAVLNSVRAAI